MTFSLINDLPVLRTTERGLIPADSPRALSLARCFQIMDKMSLREAGRSPGRSDLLWSPKGFSHGTGPWRASGENQETQRLACDNVKPQSYCLSASGGSTSPGVP